MSHVITRSCDTCLDAACVDVCPVDCIEGPLPVADIRGRPRPGLQLYIDPDVCIDCGACLPECPVEAIADDVEPGLEADRRRTAEFFLARR